MSKLLFGTAGTPESSKKRDSVSGIFEVKNLGLDAMELEFVRGVKMKRPTALKVRKAAEENNIYLTIHAPYYINLASKNKQIREKSIERILDSARIGNICGAKSVAFHASYYQDNEKEKVYEIVRNAISIILETLKKEKIDIKISPELTGRLSQFGSLDELIQLAKDFNGEIGLCFDFAHQHARTRNHNSYNEFLADLEKIEKELGQKALKNMHIHISGINYNEKGERNHLMLEDSDLKYKEILKALIKKNVSGVVICESPVKYKDAMLLKEVYKKLTMSTDTIGKGLNFMRN